MTTHNMIIMRVTTNNAITGIFEVFAHNSRGHIPDLKKLLRTVKIILTLSEGSTMLF